MAIEIFVSTQDAALAARLQDMSLWKLAEQYARNPTPSREILNCNLGV
jgi:hypothetical protein